MTILQQHLVSRPRALAGTARIMVETQRNSPAPGRFCRLEFLRANQVPATVALKHNQHVSKPETNNCYTSRPRYNVL